MRMWNLEYAAASVAGLLAEEKIVGASYRVGVEVWHHPGLITAYASATIVWDTHECITAHEQTWEQAVSDLRRQLVRRRPAEIPALVTTPGEGPPC